MAAREQGAVRFLLGGEERTVAGLPPTTTVLDYLRRHERMTGTKEGCAEGDCGACTVVLRQPDGKGGLRTWPANACIRFLPMVHGCQVLTVEHLRRSDGTLHPVQQALVDRHASQCGFCTPGFVMQIHAAWLAGREFDAMALNDWLAGNLCRCTGYGPILSAAADVLDGTDSAARAGEEPDEATLAARLAALDHGGPLLHHDGQRWFAPRTLGELAETCTAHPDAVLVAGATDVGLWVTKAHRHLETLIDVTRVDGLGGIREEEAALVIGAATTLDEAHGALAGLHADIGALMRRFAAVQIRQSGTVGGNIANGSPIGDLPPVLIALGAELVLRRGGETRRIALEDFFIAYGRQDRAPGEFVVEIRVPVPAAGAKFFCHKISKRFDQDISAVLAAFHVVTEGSDIAEARLAFGGMAATPKRATAAETALAAGGWTEAGIAAAAAALDADFAPLTDMRASAGYRLKVAQNLLRRFWLEIGGDAPARLPVFADADTARAGHV